MKWAGLTALCLSLSMTGFYFSYIHRKKLQVLTSLSVFFREFPSFVKMFSLDAAGAVIRMHDQGKFSALAFLPLIANNYTYGCNMKELWQTSVNESGILSLLDKNMSVSVLSFSDILSKNSGEDFFLKCGEYSVAFEEYAQREAEKWEKSRSFVSLSGVLAAALVFLIFI